MLRKKHSLPWGQSSLRKQPKNFSLEMLSPFSSHLFTHTHTHASAHPYTHTNLLLTLSPSNRQVVKRRRRTDPQRNREYDRRMWLMGAAKPLHFDLCLSDTNTHTHTLSDTINKQCVSLSAHSLRVGTSGLLPNRACVCVLMCGSWLSGIVCHKLGKY